MRMHCSFMGIWYSLLLLHSAAPAHAQTEIADKPTSPSGACASAEYRQFDFWIGDWEVRRPDGKPAGTNQISRILGGCVIQENWSGAGGSSGTSYNIYDRMRRRWHQTFTAARMTLRGETLDSSGVRLLLVVFDGRYVRRR